MLKKDDNDNEDSSPAAGGDMEKFEELFEKLLK